MLRPRTLFLAAPVLGWFIWSATDKLSPKYNYAEYGDKVQAWYNPKCVSRLVGTTSAYTALAAPYPCCPPTTHAHTCRTSRWETPAPWDPTYQANKRNTKMVTRKEVYLSVAPTVGTLGSALPPAMVATAVAAQVQDAAQALPDTSTPAVVNAAPKDEPPNSAPTLVAVAATQSPAAVKEVPSSAAGNSSQPQSAASPGVSSPTLTVAASPPPARKLPPAIISMEEGVIRTNRGFILK